jgi:hypothetical protein
MAAGTWLPGTRPVGDCLELLQERPALHAMYQRFRHTLLDESALDAELVAQCERRVAWLLGPAADEPPAADARESAVFAYVDAFVRDPHGVTDAHVASMRDFLSIPQVVGLTEMLALLDGFMRFRLILSSGVR